MTIDIKKSISYSLPFILLRILHLLFYTKILQKCISLECNLHTTTNFIKAQASDIFIEASQEQNSREKKCLV